MRKGERIKADINGPTHLAERLVSLSNHLRHVGRGPRAQPMEELAFPHSIPRRLHMFHFGTSAAAISFRHSSSFLLDQKVPKSQGQNHRPAAQSPNRLTFRSGSDFCEVMTHLCKVKDGECPKAFYREDVGFVDFVWGKSNDKNTGKGGFGLSHILIDHGDEIKDFNIDPIDFILMIMSFGKLNTEGKKNRIYLEGQEFRLIVTTEWLGKSKQLLLTAFDLRPISRKNPQRAKEMKKAPKR